MKRILSLLLTVGLVFLCACSRQAEETEVVLSAPETIPASSTNPVRSTVRVAVTQLFGDSDLLQTLKYRFESETPYKLDIFSNPNSTVLSIAQTGKVDVIISQTGASMDQLISAGYVSNVRPLASNTLVLLGPESDPAGVATADTVEQALLRIAQSQNTFASCYDDSDVYKAEQKLWASAGIAIGNGRTWYYAARREISGAIREADEKSAYILADKEAYLKQADLLSLKVLMESVPGLKTDFQTACMNSAVYEDVNFEGAEAFLNWLYSEPTQNFLISFGPSNYGCSIFTINS